jgi:hypothetical protein
MILATSSEFVIRHWGVVLVVIGVIGEAVEIVPKLLWKTWADKHKRRLDIFEFVFWLILVIGLCAEIAEAASQDRELETMRRESAKLGESAKENIARLESTNKIVALQLATIESTNLVLRSNVAALDKQVIETKIQLAKANERTALTESNNFVLRKNIAELELQISKIDPTNLPIVSAIAEVRFFVSGTNLLKDWRPPKNELEAKLDRIFIRLMFKDPESGDFPMSWQCEKREKIDVPFGREPSILVTLQFKADSSVGITWLTDAEVKKWGVLPTSKFDSFKEAEIEIMGLPANLPVFGHCDITLNSTVLRNFSIDSPSLKNKIVLHRSKL